MHKSPSIGTPQQVPAARTLVKASAVALVVAVLLLITIVFPAEYGIDPLGTGEALGLSALRGGIVTEEPVAPPAGAKVIPVQEGPFALYPAEYKVDAREFVLGPYEYVEYKYHLEQGATMLFSWKANGDVIHDFHGDPEGAPSNAAQSFDKRARRQADGSFVAPFTGIHGWYWENPEGETVTVRVTTSGFYTSAHEFHYDGTRQPREIRALDTITPAGSKKEIP
jgi:hypothetical protein